MTDVLSRQTPANGLRLILASSSPRRRELVALLGLPCVVVPSRYEEPSAPDTPTNLPDFVCRLALNKAREVAGRMAADIAEGAVVLGADTLVAPDDDETGVPLGKPRDGADARAMLRRLSGSTHRVYTGIALIWEEKGQRRKEKGGTPAVAQGLAASCNQELASNERPLFASSFPLSPDLPFSCLLSPVCTRVTFRELSEQMIADYVMTGEPRDKAGAYGAQGMAAPFIESMEGDYFNVVGLPLCALGRALEAIQADWWRERTAHPLIIG